MNTANRSSSANQTEVAEAHSASTWFDLTLGRGGFGIRGRPRFVHRSQ